MCNRVFVVSVGGRPHMTTTQTRTFDGVPTREIVDYINRTADLIQNLGDDYADARDELRAEYDVAVAELKSRSPSNESVDATEPSLAEVAPESDTDAGHYLTHVTEDTTEFSARHSRTTDTVVEGGEIVHVVEETYDEDAHGDSLAWRYGHSSDCLSCGAETESERATGEGQKVMDVACTECQFTAQYVSKKAEYGTPDDKRPVSFRAMIPHSEDEDAHSAWEAAAEDADNVSGTANIVRALVLDKMNAIGQIRDAAYNRDEKEIKTVECGACGDVVEEPGTRSHSHFGDVCGGCEGRETWSVDDAELPSDVEAKFDAHKSVTPSRLVNLLRDVLFYPSYIAVQNDDTDLSDAPNITTGKGGKRGVYGNGRPGTGMRRPNGALYNNSHWRTLLGDAVDTGLIERVDDSDTRSDEDAGAAWSVTEKGRDVFSEQAVCKTCGGKKTPYLRVSTSTTGQGYSRKSTRLTVTCGDCEELTSTPGALTLASSTGGHSHRELPGVDY